MIKAKRIRLHNVGLRTFLVTTMLLVALFSARSVSSQEVETGYGRRLGTGYRKSVNGTFVLSEMFRSRDFEVKSWKSLSPRIEQSDVIIWFPDRFELPELDAVQRLERWLQTEPNRTLIFVGRDYDGAEQYWQSVLDQATDANESPEQLDVLRRRLAFAQAEFDARRSRILQNEEHEWLYLDPTNRPRLAEGISGPLADGVNEERVQLVIRSQLLGPGGVQVDVESENVGFGRWVTPLLWSDGELLAYRIDDSKFAPGSKLIVVNNASFLTNLGLVNHEHRLLAGNLIDEIEYGEQVLFLESGPDPIDVIDVDPVDQQPTQWDWMSQWPINLVMSQIFVVMLIYCFAYFPIFGRARDLDDQSVFDFGRHIKALGRLFAKTEDGSYMLGRIKHYQETVRRDSGTSHVRTDDE